MPYGFVKFLRAIQFSAQIRIIALTCFCGRSLLRTEKLEFQFSEGEADSIRDRSDQSGTESNAHDVAVLELMGFAFISQKASIFYGLFIPII